MSNSSRGKDVQAKQENETRDTKLAKKTASTTSSRQWGAFRNPRIVCGPRSYGGKDRHSKVCTIKGLRDRRIRLSVPSAIMVYDLQHKLGLGQPSKVVDWLLNETKHEIDKLPPLPFPPQEYFSQFKPKTLIPHDLNAPQSSLSPFFHAISEFNKDGGVGFNKRDGEHNQTFVGKSKYWIGSDADSRVKSKGVEEENIIGHNKWHISRFTSNAQENQGNEVSGVYIPQLSAQNFFPLANQYSFPSLLSSSSTSSYNWDPSTLSLSQFGNQSFPSQLDLHTTSLQILPSLSPQCPPFVHSSIENHPTQTNNHFQLLCSTSQQHLVPNSLLPPFRFVPPFNVNPKVTNSATNNVTTK